MFLFCVQMIGVAALVSFLVAVTIGEDLLAGWIRYTDSFHPLERELRAVAERVRRYH